MKINNYPNNYISRYLTRLLLFFVLALISPAIYGANPERIKIEKGPYLQAVGENEFTVCWRTNMNSVGWIEIAPADGTHFYKKVRPKYFDSTYGRKNIGRFHKVRITGLEPGKTYRYRVMQNSVLLDEDYTRIIYGEGFGSDILTHKPYQVTTLDPARKSVKFAVGNDFHEKDSVLCSVFANARRKGYDFVMFNGDMTTRMKNEDYIFDNYLQSASVLFASDIPLYMNRGNHENRGSFATHFMDLFPTLTGTPYYTFRQGPVFFLVIDSTEDKPDNDIRNLDIMCQDEYRAQELEWLKGVLASDEFKNAPVRIVFMHMPPDGRPGSWYGTQYLNDNFMPLLNEAGIDLMLSGHYHSYKFLPEGSDGYNNAFPIIIHDDAVLLEAEADENGIKVVTYDSNQNPEHKHEFPVNRK